MEPRSIPNNSVPREIFSLCCYRCGHAWVSRNGDLPKRCPCCHSSRWDSPVMKDAVCKFCGHKWRLGSIDKKCPSCGSDKWNVLVDKRTEDKKIAEKCQNDPRKLSDMISADIGDCEIYLAFARGESGISISRRLNRSLGHVMSVVSAVRNNV